MSEDVLAQILARLMSLEGMEGRLLAQINAGNERLLTSLDGIREDLTVIGAANDRTRLAGQNTRDEGREITNALANIERILLKHGTRLDELEKRKP